MVNMRRWLNHYWLSKEKCCSLTAVGSCFEWRGTVDGTASQREFLLMEWIQSVTIIWHEASPVSLGNDWSDFNYAQFRHRSDGRSYQVTGILKNSYRSSVLSINSREESWNIFLKEEPKLPSMTAEEFLANAEEFRAAKNGAYL